MRQEGLQPPGRARHDVERHAAGREHPRNLALKVRKVRNVLHHMRGKDQIAWGVGTRQLFPIVHRHRKPSPHRCPDVHGRHWVEPPRQKAVGAPNPQDASPGTAISRKHQRPVEFGGSQVVQILEIPFQLEGSRTKTNSLQPWRRPAVRCCIRRRPRAVAKSITLRGLATSKGQPPSQSIISYQSDMPRRSSRLARRRRTSHRSPTRYGA